MDITPYHVGDTVRVLDCGWTETHGALINAIGTICQVARNRVGIQFDFAFNDCHNCSGTATNGYGYYFGGKQRDRIELVSEALPLDNLMLDSFLE